MADTIQNIKLTANTWVDLYAASGVTVGVQIVTSNLSETPVKLFSGAVVPAGAENNDDTGYFDSLGVNDDSVNDSGDAGAWAYSHTDGLVNVKVF